MKRFLGTLISVMLCIGIHAQNNVIIKAGTYVPIKSQNNVRAIDVKTGQTISFIVSRDVVIDGKTVIPYGSTAKATITLAKRSSWWGTKGRLEFILNNVILPDGTTIPISPDVIEITGENRTPLSVITFLFIWPCCFICGTKAEIPAGYEINAQVATTTTVSI